MFNSLNKKYLLPRLLGQSTAQIKILKNKNSNYSSMLRTPTDPLSYTPLTAKSSLTTQLSDKSKSPLLRSRSTHAISNPIRRPKKASVSISASTSRSSLSNKSKQPSFGKGHVLQQLRKIKNIKSNVSIINQPLAPKFNINSKLVKRAELCASYAAYNSNIGYPSAAIRTLQRRVRKTADLSLISTILPNSKRSEKGIVAATSSIVSADNKRFLFLYFILPIFFTTLKNIAAAPRRGTTTIRSEESRAKTKLKNLNNQKKQLRSLIKLMLNSVLLLRSSKLAKVPTTIATPIHKLAASIIAHPHATGLAQKGKVLLRTQPLRLKTEGGKYSEAHPQTMTNTEPTNPVQLKEEYSPTAKKAKVATGHTQRSATKGKVALRSYTTALELLKWSVLFIGQSLTPLKKKKQEYYSLIFIKILEARGFLALNNKNNLLRYAAASLPKNNVAEQSGRNNKAIAQKKVLTRAKKTIQTLDKNKTHSLTKHKTDNNNSTYGNRLLVPKTAYPSWKRTPLRPSIAKQKRVGDTATIPTAPTVDALAQRSQRSVMTPLQSRGTTSRQSEISSTLTALTTLTPRPTINKIVSKKVKGKNVRSRNTATNSVLSYGSQALQLRREAKKQIASTDLDTEYTNTNKLGLITFYPGGRNISD